MTIDIIVSSTGDHVLRGPRLVADQSVIFNNVAQSVKSGSRGGVGDRNVGVCDDARGECDARADGDGSPELSEVMMVNVDCLVPGRDEEQQEVDRSRARVQSPSRNRPMSKISRGIRF